MNPATCCGFRCCIWTTASIGRAGSKRPGPPTKAFCTVRSLNHASMLIDAAIDGQGIALARTMLAANDLIARRLVRPFRTALPLKNTYWMVCPKATRALPKITAFRDWLLTEVAADRQRLAAVNKIAPR